MAKKCKRCDQLKPHNDFSVCKSNKGGYATLCKACTVLRNTEYWRTPVGRISKIYSTQISSSKVRKHLAPTYTRKELIAWAFKEGLEKLMQPWIDSGYTTDLAPSVDRHDPNKGYSMENIRLVTWGENNEKGAQDRKTCKHITQQNRRIEQLTLNGEHVAFHDSIASAARKTGIARTNINGMCKGKAYVKSVGGFIWRYVDARTTYQHAA